MFLRLCRRERARHGLPVRPQPAGPVLQDVRRVRRLHGLRQEVRRSGALAKKTSDLGPNILLHF